MRRYIALSSIIIPADRQRKEFDEDANQSLMSSIQSVGLLQAPVLELVGSDYVLRAGERRYRAISDIYALNGTFSYDGEAVPAGLVPHTLWGELTELQRLEIEVDENECREPFTWQEKAEATAKLTRLRMMQAEIANRPEPTVADIAKELKGSSLGSAHTDVRNDLILSKHLHDPDVAKAKTSKEAMLILKKKEQAAQHLRLAQAQGESFTSPKHQCFNEDSRIWASRQPDGLFDAICTDPPYGIGADNFGESEGGTAGSHGYDDSPETLHSIIEWFAPESFRLAKPQAHLYLFCDSDWFQAWRVTLSLAGWKVFRTPLIWVRPTGFRTPWITCGPQRKYEMILYAVKGEKPVNMIAPDAFVLQSAGEGLGHPAAKPAAIYTELLRRSVKPGDVIGDLFCGTGPIFGAADELSCSAIGVEQVQTFYGIALAQIAKGKLGNEPELTGL